MKIYGIFEGGKDERRRKSRLGLRGLGVRRSGLGVVIWY